METINSVVANEGKQIETEMIIYYLFKLLVFIFKKGQIGFNFFEVSVHIAHITFQFLLSRLEFFVCLPEDIFFCF